MKEKRAIEHLRAVQSGNAEFRVPDEPYYLAPDQPIVGRYVRVTEDANKDRSCGSATAGTWVWQPPEPTTASRRPAKRHKGSFRGSSVDPLENREKVYESYRLEYGQLWILMADPRVVEIHDQPPPVTFVTAEGRERQHTFDYRAVFRNGRRVAYALKPSERVERTGIETTLALIRQQSLVGFADTAVLRTEQTITRRAIHNARTLVWARSRRNQHDVDIAVARVAELLGAVQLKELVRALGLGPRGRVAALCLIDEEVLSFEDGAWIGDETVLFPTVPESNAA